MIPGRLRFLTSLPLLPTRAGCAAVALALQQIGGSGALFSRAIRKEEIWNHQIRLKNSRKITVRRTRDAEFAEQTAREAALEAERQAARDAR